MKNTDYEVVAISKLFKPFRGPLSEVVSEDVAFIMYITDHGKDARRAKGAIAEHGRFHCRQVVLGGKHYVFMCAGCESLKFHDEPHSPPSSQAIHIGHGVMSKSGLLLMYLPSNSLDSMHRHRHREVMVPLYGSIYILGGCSKHPYGLLIEPMVRHQLFTLAEPALVLLIKPEIRDGYTKEDCMVDPRYRFVVRSPHNQAAATESIS